MIRRIASWPAAVALMVVLVLVVVSVVALAADPIVVSVCRGGLA